MAGDIKLKIGADTSEFERKLTDLTKKVQDMQKSAQTTPAVARAESISAPGTKAFQQAYQQERASIKKNADERDAFAITIRGLSQKEKELEKISKMEAASAGNAKHLVYLAEQRNKLEKEYQVLLQTRNRLGQSAFGGVTGGDPRAQMAGGGGGRGGPPGLVGANSSSGGFQTFMEALAKPAALAAGVYAVAKIANMVEGTRRFSAESQLRAREVEASAFNTQGQGGQRIENFLNGGASQELMYNPQMGQASEYAKSAISKRYSTSGPSNTPAAQAIDFLIGSQARGAFQHGNIMQGFRAIGGRYGNEGLQKEFEQNKQQEEATVQASQFEAIKNSAEGKLRTVTADKFLKDWSRNLDFQRKMGQSESSFRSFLGESNTAGFTDEQGMGMSSNILGAGGSTRSARGNAAFGLQMQRAFDLTNSGQALGQISGQLGSSQMSKDALVKIQAEGTRIGVNQSDFREENRKFVEMAASVISQSTATSGAGVDQLVRTLGSFMGERTASGLEAGKSAYQAYQSQSNTQGGPSATMRAAGILKSPVLSKLNGEQQASLFTMNDADVNVDDVGIKSMAAKAGVSPQALVDEYHKVQGASTFQRKSTDIAISNLAQRYQQNYGPSASGATYGGNISATETAEGAALNAMPLEPVAQGLSRKAQSALVRSRARGDVGEITQAEQQQIQSEAEAGKTGRPGDVVNAQQAEASRMANELFTSIQKSIVPAALEVATFTKNIDALITAMRGGNSNNIQAAINALNASHPGVMPASNVPSAGPPSSGPGH